MQSPTSWLVDRLFEFYPNLATLTVNNDPQMTPREWVHGRVFWGIGHGFTIFWGDARGTYGALMMRPLNEHLLTEINYDYWGTICDFDLAGTICGIDFAYGAGLYPEMLEVVKATKCSLLAWRHRDRLHVRPLESMPRRAIAYRVH
jgi:hypothetical protein